MFRRYLAALLLVALMAGGGLYEAAIAQQGGLVHPGQALDKFNRDPVVGSVTAWPRFVRTGDDGGCATYGDVPLDTQFSDASGRFAVSIDAAQRTYTITYCANGYYQRTDRAIANAPNGAAVLPTPAALWPVAVQTSGSEAFDTAVRDQAVLALNELAYLRSLNPEQFGSAMSAYANILAETDGGKAETFQALSNLVEAWGR